MIHHLETIARETGIALSAVPVQTARE